MKSSKRRIRDSREAGDIEETFRGAFLGLAACVFCSGPFLLLATASGAETGKPSPTPPASQPAAPVRIDLTIDGKTFKGARLSSVKPGVANILHQGGVAAIPLEQLSREQIESLNETSKHHRISDDWKAQLEAWKKHETARIAAFREAAAKAKPAAMPNPGGGSTSGQKGKAKSKGKEKGKGKGNSNGTSVAAANQSRLSLLPSWREPYGGKPHSIADLKKLFKPLATGTLDSGAHPKLELVRGLHYLMPYEEAREALKLGDVVSANGIGTPGFPARTLHYRAFDGNFGLGFNRLYLVLDAADQVIAIQFVNESPNGIKRGPGNGLAKIPVISTIHWVRDSHTFNFITLRKKGTPGSSVRIEVKTVGAGGSAVPGRGSTAGNTGVPTLYAIDSVFSSGRGTGEVVRWIVPQPIADLIHHCCTMPGVGKGISTGGLSTGGL